MNWALRRQMIYISVPLVIILIIAIVVGFRLLNEEPTCFDGKRNGAETGVDVGGECQALDTSFLRSVVPLWQRAFHVADNVYNVVAYFENQNQNAAINSVPYEISVFDNENLLIATRTGRTFVTANGRSAILEPALNLGNRDVGDTFFKFTGPLEWKRQEPIFSGTTLRVEDITIEDTDTTPRVSARIVNVSDRDLYDIEVVVIMYGEDGNALHASSTFVPRILKNTSDQVFFTWPAPFEGRVIRAEILPRVNGLSRKNRS